MSGEHTVTVQIGGDMMGRTTTDPIHLCDHEVDCRVTLCGIELFVADVGWSKGGGWTNPDAHACQTCVDVATPGQLAKAARGGGMWRHLFVAALGASK